MKLFLFLFVVYVQGGLPPVDACTNERVISCLLAMLDTNHDTNITVAEINNYTLNQPCGRDPSNPNGYAIMSKCDINNDNVLNEFDYYAPNSCINAKAFMYAICKQCDICKL